MNPSHSDLYLQRERSDVDQNTLAPQEHRAFASEWTQENPWLAVPSLVAAIPTYTALKAIGAIKSRSPASFREMGQGFAGIMDGLRMLSR